MKVGSGKISVLIIGQNSEETLKRCLDSLVRFDEVVFIDGGSTDKTEDIAKSYENVKFVVNPWPGFVDQRNFSIDQASHEWCFMIDSDEACTPELADALYQTIESENPYPIYRVMRTEYFLGQAIETGHGKASWQERLFIKDRTRYGGGVHHKHFVDGTYVEYNDKRLGTIDSKVRVLHDNRYGLEDWVKKVPRFGIVIAREKMKPGRVVTASEVFFSFFGTFFQILWKSRKEGKVGFMIAITTALHRCLVKTLMYEKTQIGFDDKDEPMNLG